MSSQLPPNPIVDTYNPAYWGEENIAITASYLAANYLQFPFAQGDETFGGISVNAGADFNGLMTIDNTATFSVQPLQTATQPLATDSSTKMPTTAWVQSAIANVVGGDGNALLSSENTWTNSNTFSAISYATKPSVNEIGTQIPTTSWVNDAITTAISNITPTNPTSVVWTFDRNTDATFNLTFPTGVFSYNIVVQAPGGNAGLGITNTSGGDTYFRLGGMGGGGGGTASTTPIPNNSAEANGGQFWSEDGQTWTANYTASTGFLELISTSGNYATAYAGSSGGDTTGSAQSPSGGGGGGGGSGGPPGNNNWTNGSSQFLFLGTAGFGGANGATGALINLTTTTGLTPPYSNVNPAVPANLDLSLYTQGASGSTTQTSINTNTYNLGGSGMGQFYAPFGSTTAIINGTNYYGFDGAPKGQGQITLNFTYNLAGQVGGTNASFIAYDDPDPATKTKQIFTDKEGLVVSQDLTGSYKTTTLTPTDLTQDLNGVVSTALIADIISVANAGASNLDAVLTAGNSAGSNNIDMNTNNINNGGTITASSFVGALTGNASSATDATNVAVNTILTGVYYPALVNNTTGNLPVGAKSNLTYNATTSALTSTTFVGALTGTATNATNVAITTDNTNGTYYIPFSKTSGTGNKALFQDDTTGPLSYNPSTSTLSASALSATTLTTTNLTINSPYNFSVVSIYTNATTRDAGIPSPYAGQMAFLTGSNKLQYWNTNWNNVSVILNNPVITGFTLATQYELIYVNASNSVITAPTLGGFTIVRFFPTTTTSGTITLPETTSVDYLVVGGGGGGAGGSFTINNGGGGGAGGLLTATDSMVEQVSYAVSVGGGGTAGAIASSGGSGTNSSLVVSSGTITATGGGGGGGGLAGLSGGSGGGAGYTGSVLAGGAGTALQGSAGGSSTTISPYPYSGGGGGAGAVGSSSVGQGGVGLSSTITGATLFYAGGGGGGASAGSPAPATLPTGGNGGGGSGGYFNGVPPTAGTDGRGGGGGGRGNTTSSAGAKGGSGVVIVRFASYT